MIHHNLLYGQAAASKISTRKKCCWWFTFLGAARENPPVEPKELQLLFIRTLYNTQLWGRR